MAARQDGVIAPLWAQPATALAEGYRRGAFDPVDVLDACLARVAATNPRLNALVTSNPCARDEAEASARRLREGRARGPLEGLPIAIKDNLVTAGLRTTWGTRGLSDYVPDADELPVARLRESGAVILGKTNVPEFTLEGYTANPLFGVTRNPWDERLTPGGSSGGAVAGCAAGMFPLALCTDGGGSIRRPASHTGLVGLKPSIGAVARGGGLPPLLLDFEVVGPIARTVADAAVLFEAIRGPDARDPLSQDVPRLAPTARPLVILCVERFGDHPLDPEVSGSFADAMRALSALGHRVERGPLPLDLEAVEAFWPQVGQAGLARAFAAWPALRDGASPKYVGMAAQGEAIGDERFRAGVTAVEALRRAAAALFARIDVVMTPTAAALPWPAEQAFPSTIAGHAVGPRGHAVYTGWVNVCGHPAISVPSTPSSGGLPIGVQLVGARGADELLLELARAYERVNPWDARRPLR